jgi:uncharacterized damage-inducible protein DinB
MSISQAMLAEMQHEAANSRKMLEVVPADKLDWQPHEKSMTLKRLAGHLAEIPGWAAVMVGHDELDFAAGNFTPFQPTTVEEVLETHDSSVAAFNSALAGQDDATLMKSWTMKNGDHVYFTLPCAVAMRSFIFSHMVHHRGQLSVFLRLLDVSLPQVYGPTADAPDF